MSTLPKFPMVAQRSTTTGDNMPSEDAQYACVAASIDAACRYLLGQPENSIFNPDHFKDEGAGQGYVGFTSASEYVPFCASLGVKLAPVNSNNADLVAKAHQYIQAGMPVVFTEPDPYVPSSYGWSHVCCFFGEGPGYLVSMDPWPAQAITRSDQDWTQLLLFNQVWTLARMEVPITITINTPGVSAYFQQQDAQHWLCPATGRIIQYGILQAYCSLGNAGLCGLTLVGLPISNELPIGPNATKQFFERGCLVWDPAKSIDNPPGSGPVYLAHIYTDGPNGGTPPGQDPEIAVLQQELATAQNGAQLASLEQRLTQIKTLSTL